MGDILLPGSVVIFVLVCGWILFKKFLKFVIIIALLVGLATFYSQDSFAGGISDFLDGKSEVKTKKKRSKFVMFQNDEGTTFIVPRKGHRLMEISDENEIILISKTVKYNFGEISSDAKVENMIKVLFGEPELLNVAEEEED